MPFKETPIPDLLIFEPKIWGDERGYFYESYNENTFLEAGINNKFVQDNQARSTIGVLRGLHIRWVNLNKPSWSGLLKVNALTSF